MPSRTPFIRHTFNGGWATDYGQVLDAAPPDAGPMAIPFLLTAEDCLYELHGGPRKAPGTTKLNSSALESGAAIRGLYDAWFSGTAGSATQKRIVHVGTKIKADAADGTFSDIITGMSASGVPCYAMLEDYLIIGNDTDALQQYDGTTGAAVSGSPPKLACLAVHKNRMWGGGNPANPSLLYYSESLDPRVWSGGTSGSISIRPDDGDRIMSVASFKGDLLVFKGPYKGSITRITGAAPADFAQVPFIEGLGCAGPNLLASVADDLFFMWSDGNVYSLTATANYGDYREVSLSRPIGSFLRDNVAFNNLKRGWAAVDRDRGIVLWAIPINAASNPNCLLAMDFRFQPPRWSYLKSFNATCVAAVVDSAASNRMIPFTGGSDGYVRKLGQVTRTIDASTAIGWNVKSPFISYGQPWMMKTLGMVSLGIARRSSGNITFGFKGPKTGEKSLTISQGGGYHHLTPTTSDFTGFTLGDGDGTVDNSLLAGTSMGERFKMIEDSGEFRAVQYIFRETTAGQDAEIYAFTVKVEPGAESTDNEE